MSGAPTMYSLGPWPNHQILDEVEVAFREQTLQLILPISQQIKVL